MHAHHHFTPLPPYTRIPCDSLRDTTLRVAQNNSSELPVVRSQDFGDTVDPFREPGTGGIGRGSTNAGTTMFHNISHPPRRTRQSDPGGASRTSRLNPNYQPPSRVNDRPSVPVALDPINPLSYARPAASKGGMRSSVPAILPGLFPQSSAPAVPIKPANVATLPPPKIPTLGGWFTSKGKPVGPGGISPAPQSEKILVSDSPPAMTQQSSFPSAPAMGMVRGGVVSEGPMLFGRDRNSQPGRLQTLGMCACSYFGGICLLTLIRFVFSARTVPGSV